MAQSISLSVVSETAFLSAGESAAEAQTVTIDPSQIAGIKVDSFVYPEEGANTHDVTLSVKGLPEPIKSHGNGLEVLQEIAKSDPDALAVEFLTVCNYQRLIDDTGTGFGWMPPEQVETVSVPDFLKQTR